jgi:SET domain-containing protein
MKLSQLVIKPSAKGGRGVFAKKSIEANTVLEVSPVLVFDQSDVKHIEKTMLFNYVFEWDYTCKKRALGMGYVSMYNHSYTANCDYEMDYEAQTITVKTIAHIAAGEELFINYNANPNDATPIWFDAK